ncbi:MAG TPA: outer membrane beta-barrel protein [Planctomycetota bacterium]|nr:outer membrane beta-barrel protein [Planctomycetota bacterium]
MPTVLLSLLAALGGHAGDPAPLQPLSLTELLASAAPASAPPQGVAYDRAMPLGWISAGIFFTSSEQDLPGSPDEDEPLGVEVGFYTWKNREMGLGVELGAMHSEYKVNPLSLPSDTETVDVWRGTLGLRLVDAGISSLFSPFARAGALWRSDSGTTLDDSGFGYYLGVGLDWHLAGGLAITPTLTYQDSNSFNTTEWLFGLSLTFLF